MTDSTLEATVTQYNPTDAEKAYIDTLCKLGTGKLAMLKRNAGNTLVEQHRAYWFEGLLDRFDPKRYNEEVYFIVATLIAFDKDAIEGKNHFKGDFGRTLRSLRMKTIENLADDNPLDKRFNILLDADFDDHIGGELSYRLRQLVRQVTQKKDPSIQIDWAQLLHDLKYWNNDRKFIQKKWAQSYYKDYSSISENNQETIQEEGKE